ncbi:MAG: hypothetical protein ACOVRN_14815 [Flavobacterium sp.]
MPITRRLRTKRQKTQSQYGGFSEHEGIVDKVGNRLYNVASSAAQTAVDAGLKIAGLERIGAHSIGDASHNHDTSFTVPDFLDRTGASILGNINEALGSNAAKQSTEEAARTTARLVREGAATFNAALNDPIVKAELEQAIEHAGEIGSVIVKAAEKPFNEAVEVAAQAAPKITSAAVSGAIKVGTDAVAAVPFLGAVVDAGKMLNDGSKAASAMVSAGTEAIDAASDAFLETKASVERGLQALKEKKRMAEQIVNRTTRSIRDFENPTIQTGGKRTRRRLFKHKRRVQFAR